MSSARPRLALTYLDLLHPDGTLNRTAFAAILQNRIAAEVDLRLCLAAGKFAPPSVPLGEIRAWRAEQAKPVDPAQVPPDERARIAAQEHAALTAWVVAMQRGAAAQRAAMQAAGSAILQAAE